MSTESRFGGIQKAGPEEITDEAMVTEVGRQNLEGYVVFTPAKGGKVLTRDGILQGMRERKMVYGIRQEVVEQLAALGDKKDYGGRFLIAEGLAPVHGENASLSVHVTLNKKAKPTLLEDGNVDYKHLDIITSVTKDQLLATMTPPTPGTPGKTVFDIDIPAKPGRSLQMPMGKNTHLSPDGLQLFASIDGKVDIEAGRLVVSNVLFISGNVDNATGDIDFHGNVIIQENVVSGFEVRATGSIEVRGTMEGGILIAGEDVILKNGMQGLGKGRIEAGGNIIARFIENGTVTATGNIVSEAIMHSHIRCGKEILVGGKIGTIVGGSISAGNKIVAVTMGSTMSTATNLEVGMDPMLKKEYNELQGKAVTHQEELHRIKQLVEMFRQLESSGRLTVEKMIAKAKVDSHYAQLQEDIAVCRIRTRSLEEMLGAVDHGTISVSKTIHPGVHIAIGNAIKHIKEPVHFATFKKEHAEIVRSSYEG